MKSRLDLIHFLENLDMVGFRTMMSIGMITKAKKSETNS